MPRPRLPGADGDRRARLSRTRRGVRLDVLRDDHGETPSRRASRRSAPSWSRRSTTPARSSRCRRLSAPLHEESAAYGANGYISPAAFARRRGDRVPLRRAAPASAAAPPMPRRYALGAATHSVEAATSPPPPSACRQGRLQRDDPRRTPTSGLGQASARRNTAARSCSDAAMRHRDTAGDWCASRSRSRRAERVEVGGQGRRRVEVEKVIVGELSSPMTSEAQRATRNIGRCRALVSVKAGRLVRVFPVTQRLHAAKAWCQCCKRAAPPAPRPAFPAPAACLRSLPSGSLASPVTGFLRHASGQHACGMPPVTASGAKYPAIIPSYAEIKVNVFAARRRRSAASRAAASA